MPSFISNGGMWVKKVEKVDKGSVEVEMVTKDEYESKTITYNELDITRDGVVDEADASLAGKVLSETKKVIKRGRKKKSE